HYAEIAPKIREKSRKKILEHLVGICGNYSPTCLVNLKERVEGYQTEAEKFQAQIENFRVWGIGLIGKLKIEGFLQNISSLEITNCGIEELDISECVNLQEIFLANNNSLTNFNFLRQLPYPAKLKSFTVMNTIMNERTDIEIFQPFINLEVLRIKICRNLDFEKEGKTYHNSFFGSLESLKNLKKLKWLDISDTDIDNG
ncbi:30648_t:CDS:2, partial [Racocetra persica]